MNRVEIKAELSKWTIPNSFKLLSSNVVELHLINKYYTTYKEMSSTKHNLNGQKKLQVNIHTHTPIV